jgi:peptide/nickel transport system permease protein
MTSTTDTPARPAGRKTPFVRLRRPGRPAQAAGRGRRQWHVGFWLAVGWLVLIVLLAVFANLLPIKGYATPNFGNVNQPPGLRWPEFLGTDNLGRSELTRLIYGARVSLAVGFLSVGIAFVVGTTLGVLAGYFRRATEAVINVASDTLLAIPPLVLLLGITVVLKPSLRNLVIGLAVLGTPTFARLAKANTQAMARREFVSASVILGARPARVLWRDIVPNVLLPVSAFGAELIGVFIVAEASLSFLGLGVPPPQPSWGGMIAAGYPNLSTAPYLTFVPVVALFLTVFSFKVVGDRLRARFELQEAKL